MRNLTVSQLTYLVVASIVSLGLTKATSMEPTSTLTVVVNGIQNQKGEVCIGLYSQQKGFPLNTKNVVKSACTQITFLVFKGNPFCWEYKPIQTSPFWF